MFDDLMIKFRSRESGRSPPFWWSETNSICPQIELKLLQLKHDQFNVKMVNISIWFHLCDFWWLRRGFPESTISMFNCLSLVFLDLYMSHLSTHVYQGALLSPQWPWSLHSMCLCLLFPWATWPPKSNMCGHLRAKMCHLTCERSDAVMPSHLWQLTDQ